MTGQVKRLVNGTVALAWAGLLVLLPVTSLPLLADVMGSDAVAAPSILLAVWLALVWLVPYLLRGGKLPAQTIPFLGVIVVELLAAALSFFIEIPPFKNIAPLTEMLLALVTLGIGSAFYFVMTAWPQEETQLRWVLQWINVGGMVLVVWSLMQAGVVVFLENQYPDWMVALQDVLSVRRLFENRVTGLAFEPSWLAHQLNMIYLPYWLAATLQRFSVFRMRILKLSLENLLLGGGVITLVLSFSRVGWGAFGLVLTVVLAGWTIQWVRRVQGWVLDRVTVPPSLQLAPAPAHGLRSAQARQGLVKFIVSSGLVLAVFALYIGGIIGLFSLAGRIDGRLDDLTERVTEAQNFYDLANRLVIAERVVYWGAGWEVFNEYPFFGVGPGHPGFFFPEKMPPFGWFLFEIVALFYRRSFIPNTKSIWTRLLAETGIVGFAIFLAWLYVLWRSTQLTETSSRPLLKTLGQMGNFTLMALLIEGFSVDSFALPYIWLSLGLLTAAAKLIGATTDSESSG